MRVGARPLPAPALLVALLVLLLGPGVAAVSVAPPAGALPAVPAGEPLAEPTDEPFTVTVDSLSPTAPRPEDTVVLAGRVTAGEPLTDVTARLRVGRPLRTRSALARADGRLVPAGPRTSREPVADSVPAGSTRAFQLVVPASELRLESLGVHPLRLDVRARVALDSGDVAGDGTLVTRTVQTFLPTFPEPVQPTRVAVLLPLTRPPVLPGGAPGPGASADLAAELAPGGRLLGLLEAGSAGAASGVPVTWAVDPALLDAVRLLAASPSGAESREPPATPGTAASADAPAAADAGPAGPAEPARVAAHWLQRARAVLRDAPVVALPYADPDVVGLLRGGLREELELAEEAGRRLVQDVLGVTPLDGWTWPPDGLASPDSLSARVAAGARRLVLDATAVTRPGRTRTTPDARTALEVAGRVLPVLTTDSGLTALLAAGSEGPGSLPPDTTSLGETLALQRVAAETALVTAERPGSSRGLVLAPPRLWSAEASYVRRLLSGLARQPWLQPVALADLAGAPPEEEEPAELAEAAVEDVRERALSEQWMQPLAAARQSLAEFSPVLTDPPAVVTPLRLALLRGASAAWRAAEREPVGREVVGDAVRAVATLASAVRLEGGGPVLFTAETGTIPLTVVNDLAQPVVVRVSVDAAGQARLLSGAVTEVQIEPGRRRQVDVRITARTSGQFPVLARLRTPGGAPLGPPVRVTVRSTAYGRVAVAITVGAAAVLVAASGVRLVRRAWRTHHPHRA